METRVFNFSAGPSTLPLPVLEEAQRDLVVYPGAGMSVMEMSHRSKDFDAIIKDAQSRMRQIMEVPDNYHILFLQGGASLQFSMIPLNLMVEGKAADYVNTGNWANRAVIEAQRLGPVNVVGSSKDKGYSYIPKNIHYNDDASYVHITTNNTVAGTQFHEYPQTKAPLVVDMSSDIMCRKVDMSQFGLLYAGAQKNVGPAGVTIVIVRDDLLGLCDDTVPIMLNYKTHTDKDSIYNTPPTYGIYIIQLVLKHIEKIGGLDAIEAYNKKKAAMLYEAIDGSNDFYTGNVAKEDRSLMNVTFRLPTEELDKKFIEEAKQHKLYTLKGHRSVGGIRASIYNAMPMEGVETLAQFMADFLKTNG